MKKDLDFIDEMLPKLQAATLRMKTDILMQEPCPVYEGDDTDWADFWYGEDIE
jgi:hypothetical protein